MLREEPRTGRIADFEFQFWECWEYDDNVPQVLKRHWFRSDTGLEALTYDHMLQMLYRQKMSLPVGPAITSLPQPSSTSVEPKYAAALLYGLQVASVAVKKSALRRRKRRGDPQDVAYRPWSIRHILRIEK